MLWEKGKSQFKKIGPKVGGEIIFFGGGLISGSCWGRWGEPKLIKYLIQNNYDCNCLPTIKLAGRRERGRER